MKINIPYQKMFKCLNKIIHLFPESNKKHFKNKRKIFEPRNQLKMEGKYILAFFSVVASGSNLSTNNFRCKDNTFNQQLYTCNCLIKNNFLKYCFCV